MQIDRLAAGGDGVGRLENGMTVFVPLSAPGDLVRIRVIERHRRFARGEVVALLESGPGRTEPRCSVFGRCGGCSWQHLDYAVQVDAKRSLLRDALTRIGGCTPRGPIAITPSPAAYAYRGRARLLSRRGRLGYREGGSHRLCPVMRCPILTEPLQEALGRLAVQLALAPPDMGAEEVDREWELVQGGGGETRIHRLGADGGGTPGPTAGDRIALDVGGERVLLSPGTFAQSNALLLELLHAAVRRRVDGGADLLELYAGAGFFTLALARRFERVHVVEAAGTALGDLRHNLQRAGLRNVTVDGRRVEDALGQGVRSRPDVVFLDPPRVGLARGSAESLAQLGASRIVYLSCDPATLARDMAILIERGYSLESVEGFDLFPQTPHVEALATLTIR